MLFFPVTPLGEFFHQAGVRLRGRDAGGVRPPLVDPTPRHLAELARIIDAGLAVAGEVALR